MKGKATPLDIKEGKGQVILFGFKPAYRSLFLATYPLFFNAIESSLPAQSYLAGQPMSLIRKSQGHRRAKAPCETSGAKPVSAMQPKACPVKVFHYREAQK